MSTTTSKIIQWKKVYQLVSGTFYNENQEVVKKRLLEIQTELEDGIKIFRKPKADASDELEKLLKEKKQEKLLPFAQKLYKFLDLDVKLTYEILCYYLVNEYRGSAASLQNFMSNESLMIKLLNDIWFYYSLERMILLKVMKCVLEYHDSNDHPYRQAFKTIVEKIGMGNIRKSYIEQFEILLKNVQHTKLLSGDIFNSPQKLQSWSERKHRELNEILQIILLTSYYDVIQPEEILKLLELFKSHSFGKQNQFLNPTNSNHMDLIQKVNNSEIALLMVSLSTTNNDSVTWMNEVINKIDEKIIAMHHYKEHGPILLTWMIFKFASKKGNDTIDECGSYGKLGSRAVQLNVFDYLYQILTHKQFKDKSLTSRIFIRCVYDNLIFLCELFNTDGSMAKHPKIFELFSETLKLPSIAKDFCKNEENPIRSLLDSAVEQFPHSFVPLSLVAKSLSIASKLTNDWILDFLQNLPIFAEQPNDPFYELRKNDDNEEDTYVLLNDYQPFQKINDFVIPTGNIAIVREEKGKMFVYFQTKLNYFHALHNEINEMLNSIVSFSEIHEHKLQRLETGITLLASIIKRIENPDEITNEMIHPTEMVFDILEKFKVFQHPSLDLMASCLNVCTELVVYFGAEILRRFANLNIGPSITTVHRDFKTYSNGNGFELGLVGYYLIKIECSTGKYNFLKAYFNFLKKCTQLDIGDTNTIQLPGLLLIVREIFNNIHTWYFENERDRMEILLFIFDYIHEILSMSSEVIKEESGKKLLRDICVYSLLFLNNSSSLLRFIAVGNPGLQCYMENESNWFLAAESDLNLLVLNAMRILMQTLRLKESVTQNMEILTPLEQMIYTQPKQRDALKIIPIVANYTNYPFNRRFSVLSCRLLRRFAIEFQSSLTACLDLEPDQVRMMFLQRLRDDLESEHLKIAILDFVNACIDKQPGLTEAFFKVSYEQDVRNRYFIKRSVEEESTCDGIITYMEEFLEAVSKDPSKIVNDQLKRIMSLFHALWKQGLQSLVKSLTKKKNFWSSLCSPILTTPIANYQYSQLLNIMGIELFKLREANEETEDFRKVIEKFLTKEVFSKWLNVVFDMPRMSLNDSSILEETPEWLGRLQSFKDFLVLLLKKKLILKMPSDCNKILLDKTIEALIFAAEEMENGNDMRPFIVLSELYMIILNDQELKFTNNCEEDLKLLNQIETLLKITVNCYGGLHKRAKDSILAVAIKILELESDEIKNYPSISSGFVRYNLEILNAEFFNIENEDKNGNSDQPLKNASSILAINMLKKIILIGDDFYGNCAYWLNHHKLFNRLMSLLSLICRDSTKSNITGELFELLILLAKGSYSKDIIFCDIGDYLWLNLITPKFVFDSSAQKGEEWITQDWWSIYMKAIQLVKILLEKEGHLFIKDALFFMGIHEQYLTEILLLAKYSLEANAMTLIKSTLDLIAEIIKYESFWSSDYHMSFNNLTKHVQFLLDHAVSLLHRPKLLKRLTEASKAKLEEYPDSVLTDPTDELINATNGIIEIITLCSQCLLHFSPKLLNLLCDVEFNQSKWTPFIEVQFGAPKMNSSEFPQLTYGTVLSVIALLIKAINIQHHVFKQVSLNKIPVDAEQENNGSDTVSMISVSDTNNQRSLMLPSTSPSPVSPRRPFSKSISMSSMSGSIIQQPSNELLSHLDSKLCLNALEFLLTLLASQSLLALKARHLSSREKQLIRRELSTELHCLHDFVKKKILKDSTKSPLYRQKMGAFQITNNNDDDDDEPQAGPSRSSLPQRRSQDLRVNVVRKLHLQQKTPFEIPSTFSPIQNSQAKEHTPIETTPIGGKFNPTTSTSIKRVGFDLTSTNYKISVQEDDEPYVINRGDPVFTGLSLVKFIEEDYIQLLSNVFIYICQNEN